MILDAMAIIPGTGGDTNLDLDAVRPGPGEPIVCWAQGVGGTLVINGSAADEAPATPVITIDATEDVEFRLPSNCPRYVAGDHATGEVFVTLEGNQTNE